MSGGSDAPDSLGACREAYRTCAICATNTVWLFEWLVGGNARSHVEL